MDGSIVGGMFGLIVGMLGGLAATYVMARLRAQTSRLLADQIVANAHREGETIRMQAELLSKHEILTRRDALDREMEESRKELRDQERRLEKRADLLDQKLEIINRKERELESVQRFVSEQQEDSDRTARAPAANQPAGARRSALHLAAAGRRGASR